MSNSNLVIRKGVGAENRHVELESRNTKKSGRPAIGQDRSSPASGLPPRPSRSSFEVQRGGENAAINFPNLRLMIASTCCRTPTFEARNHAWRELTPSKCSFFASYANPSAARRNRSPGRLGIAARKSKFSALPDSSLRWISGSVAHRLHDLGGRSLQISEVARGAFLDRERRSDPQNVD